MQTPSLTTQSRILAVGKISKGNLQMEVAPRQEQRIAELQEFAKSEGIKLPLSIDLILRLEDRGWVVDMHTGRATQPYVGVHTPYGYAVALLHGEDA